MVNKFLAAKAFISYKGKILILKESPEYKEGSAEGKYVVPGGRARKNEKIRQALRREILEETGLEVKVEGAFLTQKTYHKINNNNTTVKRIFFRCFSYSGKITLNKDHSGYKWINPLEYMNYNLAENLKEVFESYLRAF